MRSAAQYWKERSERLESAIREALAFESILPAIATVPREILTRALEDE